MDTTKLLCKPEFPRSQSYDPDWMLDNQMGPNAIWLAEWLSSMIPLKEGMRVLDLGCGKAMSSIFLAREFNVKVWANDLWISPDHNWRRVNEAGLSNSVFPIRAEAHALPYPQSFFDAIVSLDAYQYFGTDELYLDYITGFLQAGGTIGIVVPSLMQDCTEVPHHLLAPQSNGTPFWEDGCWSFKTAEWWERLWNRCGKIENVKINSLADGWRHWRDFERALDETGKNIFPPYWEALDIDQGRYIGFVSVVARRNNKEAQNLYDPGFRLAVRIDK